MPGILSFFERRDASDRKQRHCLEQRAQLLRGPRLELRVHASTPGRSPSSSPKAAPTMNGRRGMEYGEG